MTTTRKRKQTRPVDDIPIRRTDNYVSMYANYIDVSSALWSTRVSFFEVTEDDENALVKEKKATVSMAPQCARRFFILLGGALTDTLSEEEQKIIEAAQEVITRRIEEDERDD